MKIETGQIIADRYRIEAFLGKGGMAEVYKVTDTERSAFLALKMLREELAEDVVFLRRFKREAQALARLQHPYIVRFYGLEQNERQAFILMDFVEGTTLRKEIFRQQTPFSLERIVEIARPLCSALSFAHNQGLVHCDIKPANIMLHRNGNVLLADFGIARMTESSTSISLSGAGTPGYMAPEQVRGEIPTPPTDIYSFGVVLYEMATGGERPFTGEHANKTGSSSEKVQWEQLFLDPPHPSQYNKEISPGLEAVILKCLQKDPLARPQTPLALLSELEHALRADGGQDLDQDDSMTYVPGDDGFVPEESPSIISESGRSISKTPARQTSGVSQAGALNSVAATDRKTTHNNKLNTKSAIRPKKKNRIGMVLLISLFLLGILGAGTYAALMGYFGEIPMLSAIAAPALTLAPSSTITAVSAGVTVTPSPLPVVPLTKVYENNVLGVTLNYPDNWSGPEKLDVNGYGQVSMASESDFDPLNMPEQISLAYLFFMDKSTIGNSSNITNDPASLLPVANGLIEQTNDMIGVNADLIGEITPRMMGFFPAARANLKFSHGNFDGQGEMIVLLADNRIIVFVGAAHKNHWVEKQPLFDQMVKSIKIKPAKPTVAPTLTPSATAVIFVPTQQVTPTATPTTKVDCSNINGAWNGYSVDSKGNRLVWHVRFAQVGCYMDVFFTTPYNALGVGQINGNYVTITTTFNKVQKTFQFLINRSLLEGYEIGDAGSVAYLNSGN